MRRLLVKLVAIETALVGWLAYWIFLVYASNPGVAAELAGNLQRFPQLSFSTIDIAILVMIAGIAIALAFKFQRGLRPGIRLERALQMLENLMKRNLVLEAQVAELKIEKAQVGPPITTTPRTMSTAEPRPGSWEKAFRTPLEAGPATTPKPSTSGYPDLFEHETTAAPPRIEAKPPLSAPRPSSNSSPRPQMMIAEKPSEKSSPIPAGGQGKVFEKQASTILTSPATSSSWEDSPKFVGESRGILNPSGPPRRTPTISESGGLRQPYIPAPAPKARPPGVIIGPMSSSPTAQPGHVPRPPAAGQTSPRSITSSGSSRPSPTITKPSTSLPVTRKESASSQPSGASSATTGALRPSPPQIEDISPSPSSPKPGLSERAVTDAEKKRTRPSESETESSDGMMDAKPSSQTKKKFPYEED